VQQGGCNHKTPISDDSVAGLRFMSGNCRLRKIWLYKANKLPGETRDSAVKDTLLVEKGIRGI